MQEKRTVISTIIIIILVVLLTISIGYIVYQKSSLKKVCLDKFPCNIDKECPKCEVCKECSNDNNIKVISTENIRSINKWDITISIDDKKQVYLDKGSQGYETVKLDSDAVALNYTNNCGGSIMIYALDANGKVYVSKNNGKPEEDLSFINVKTDISEKIVGFRSIDTSSTSCFSRSLNLVGISGKEYQVYTSCSDGGHIVDVASTNEEDVKNGGSCIPK